MSKGEHSVESSTIPGVRYSVDLEAGTCSCEATVKVCRHIRQGLIRDHKARGLAGCAGCGGMVPRRQLVEVGEEQASWGFALFVGDRLCPECASHHGL